MNSFSHLPKVVVHSRRWRDRLTVGLLLLLALGAMTESQAQVAQRPVVGEPVTPDTIAVDLREAPPVRLWQPGDSVYIVPEGFPPEYDNPGVPAKRKSTRSTTRSDSSARDTVGLLKPTRPIRVIPEEDDQSANPQSRGLNRESLPNRVSMRAPVLPAPTLVANFAGIPSTGAVPPDVVGDIGPDHYVQMVNSVFAIYDRSGTLLAGPSSINSIWAGFGGQCESTNRGDPIVQYDHLADRWVLSQFAFDRDPVGNPVPPFFECIAVSRTPDPVVGGWFRYAFQTPAFPDYPKIGVWPDAYYMSTYEGANLGAFAFDRSRMLSGLTAQSIRFTVPSLSAGRSRTRILPSDLEGALPPTPGTPNPYLRSIDGQAQGGGMDRLEIFEFHADFTNPMNSTFTGPTTLATAPYDIQMCGNALPRACIPQPGTTQSLDPLSNRLMQRAQYRNFGTHETHVASQTVDAMSQDVAGIRWYELRRAGGTWTIHQQGTFSPDSTNHRWMGSAAMDKDGNMALAYTVASRSEFPGIRYTGRLANDPLGTMGNEFVLVGGGGSQTFSPRWGDYSSMNIDPKDDCTFWYTGEFYPATTTGGWRTQIGRFKNPSCGRKPYAFMYSSKIICGLQRDPKNMRLTRGFYATAINVHNPEDTTVTFFKKLALTFPPEEQRPGKIIPIGTDVLRADEALEVDCIDVQRKLFPRGFRSSYIKGFVVIKSSSSLDVTAVYTTAALDEKGLPTEHSSIDVEQIAERRISPKPERLPDLLPVPGPRGSFCQLANGILKVTIKNQGGAAAPASKTKVDYFRYGSVSQPTSSLPSGGQTDLFFKVPLGCHDPDCDFRIEADTDLSVPEENESNNKVTDICIG